MNAALPHIIVVHGALGSRAQMQPVADALRVLGTVTVVELPGHGTTVLGNSEFSIQTFVAALSDAVQSLSYPSNGDPIGKPVVFGYSMGGYIALALEVQRPGTFGAIATLGTKFAWTPELAAQENLRLDADVIEQKVPKFAVALAERHAGSGGWRNVLSHTRALLTSLGDTPVLTQSSLSSVTIPVCVVVGERDDTVNAQEAANFARYTKQGFTAIVEGAPHPIERVPLDRLVELVRSLNSR